MYEYLIRLNHLTDTEEILRDYIIRNYDEIVFLTIYELSEKTYVSVSAIVRFCKKIGYDGYKDFKVNLLKEISNRESSENVALRLVEDIQNTINSPSEVMALMAHNYKEIISKTYFYINDEVVSKVINLIMESDRIFGVGVSNSYLRLQDLQVKLVKFGINIYLINFQPEQFYFATHSNEKDLAILISYSGSTAEIVNDARIFRKNGSKIISITSNLDSYLAEVSDVVLELPKIEKKEILDDNLVAEISISYCINLIYYCILKKLDPKNLSHTPVSRF